MRNGSQDEVWGPERSATEQALLKGYARFLGFLERRVGQRATAEELLQSAYARALERGVPADGDESAVAWFYAVLRHAVVDYYRRSGAERRAVEHEQRGPAPDTLEVELKDAVCACIRDVLPSMKPEYAQMVQLVDLDERPVGEVAAELGVTANNATVRLHRARQALKQQLQRCCGACATHGCLECGCAASRHARAAVPKT